MVCVGVTAHTSVQVYISKLKVGSPPWPRPGWLRGGAGGDHLQNAPTCILKRLRSSLQGQEVQLLGQVELCFSKDLQLQNCSHAAEPAARRQEAWPNLGLHVCNDGPVLYPPLNETKL